MELTKQESGLVVSFFLLFLSKDEISEALSEALINDEQTMELSRELDRLNERIKNEEERRKIAATAFGKLANHMLGEETRR